MVSAVEGALAAGAVQEAKERQQRLEASKPKMSLLHHIAATQAMTTGFTVILTDGGSYKAEKGDFVFTDGLSIVHEGRRMYFPLTAIKAIIIHNPADHI